MNVKFLALGLFESMHSAKQTDFYDHSRIKNYYKNILFHFKMNISAEEDLKLLPTGGLFSPSKVETYFYKKETENVDFDVSQMIDRQPDFFAFILPYPVLKWGRGYPTDDGAYNNKPFSKIRSGYISKRYDDYIFNHELSGKMNIRNGFFRESQINDFFENNCYPIFIKDHNELGFLINDYNAFIKNTFNLNLTFKSLSKIIIPFFELEEQEKKQISTMNFELPF